MNKLDYVDNAEKVIKGLIDDRGNIRITTNKIRNLLTLVNELYNMAKEDKNAKLSLDVQSHIQYIRMKLAYEAGRDRGVKEFIGKSKILDLLKSVGDSREKLMLVCHYMEALVAYHRYYTNEK